MPDVKIEKQPTLDLLDVVSPKTSSTSDMPVIETKPDSSPKDAPVEEKAEESTTSEQPETSTAEPEPKKAKGVQKRIDELTRQREDERRRAEAAEARELRILGALEKATGAKETKADTEDKEPVKPKKADFTDPESYDAALETWIMDRAAWVADQKVKSWSAEQERKSLEAAQVAQTRKVQEDFKRRSEETAKKYPDYHEIAESPDVQVSFPMAYAILQSEQGPEIQYYLGKNPEEAKRISSMIITDAGGNSVPDVARQLVELGVIAARLNQPAAKPVSAAPAPGKPIKAGETASVSTNLEDLDKEGMEAYAAVRKPQLMARKGPGARA